MALSDFLHIIYKVTQISTGEYYIGRYIVDSEKYPDSSKDYFGSSDWVLETLATYGPSDLKKEILEKATNLSEAIEIEEKYLSEQILQDPLCINARAEDDAVLEESDYTESAEQTSCTESFVKGFVKISKLARSLGV